MTKNYIGKKVWRCDHIDLNFEKLKPHTVHFHFPKSHYEWPFVNRLNSPHCYSYCELRDHSVEVNLNLRITFMRNKMPRCMDGNLHREEAKGIFCGLCLHILATQIVWVCQQSHKKEGREWKNQPDECIFFCAPSSLTFDKLFTMKPLQ